MVKAVVYRESALGLLRGDMVEVLNVIASGKNTLIENSPLFAYQEELRQATKDDFERFNVRCLGNYEIAKC